MVNTGQDLGRFRGSRGLNFPASDPILLQPPYSTVTGLGSETQPLLPSCSLGTSPPRPSFPAAFPAAARRSPATQFYAASEPRGALSAASAACGAPLGPAYLRFIVPVCQDSALLFSTSPRPPGGTVLQARPGCRTTLPVSSADLLVADQPPSACRRSA